MSGMKLLVCVIAICLVASVVAYLALFVFDSKGDDMNAGNDNRVNIELTTETFSEWAEILWRDFNVYRQKEAKYLSPWSEIAKESKNDPGRVDCVTVQTVVCTESQEPVRGEIFDLVELHYKFREDRIIAFGLSRADKEFEPELEFILVYDDVNGKSSRVLIGKTMGGIIRETGRVSRNADNEGMFRKLDAILFEIEKDSGFEARIERWEGLWDSEDSGD